MRGSPFLLVEVAFCLPWALTYIHLVRFADKRRARQLRTLTTPYMDMDIRLDLHFHLPKKGQA
jgi:hypothetical protein